jgi:hypothetical protein
MLWWAWKTDEVGRPFIEAFDRHPQQLRLPIPVGVRVYYRRRDTRLARETARALNRKAGIPIGWPGPEAKDWPGGI